MSETKDYFVHETARVDEPCQIGKATSVWHFSHIMKDVRIGDGCNIGQNVFIASGVEVGSFVKIQNNVSIYAGTVIEDYVFLGPSCVLTNVMNPRSEITRHGLYEKTVFRRGATVGANATIVCGVELGRYCFIGAGSVIIEDVADYALMVGSTGKQIGWMSRHGVKLPHPDSERIMICPESGFRYKEIEAGVLRCLDLDEQAQLPEEHRVGKKFYKDFKV